MWIWLNSSRSLHRSHPLRTYVPFLLGTISHRHAISWFLQRSMRGYLDCLYIDVNLRHLRSTILSSISRGCIRVAIQRHLNHGIRFIRPYVSFSTISSPSSQLVIPPVSPLIAKSLQCILCPNCTRSIIHLNHTSTKPSRIVLHCTCLLVTKSPVTHSRERRINETCNYNDICLWSNDNQDYPCTPFRGEADIGPSDETTLSIFHEFASPVIPAFNTD